MVEGHIKKWKATIARLESIIENENLTVEQAKQVREQYELAHWMLDQLIGSKGDKKEE
ncbi:hypothetical protein G8759_25285 [Spirosoma aureum]|uniref:Uncharacterized protein n=1 Tax=Spirosoma aureum TaxID=2692134 RepID=A0A6G9ATH8_9BACT|nr:hypothetical protein [Spirosoma aureum]QIP15710.1 hypothetical protein G8759_25285 [Spirosoma aureum]